MFKANISFFHKFDNLAAILNILAYFRQTQPEMHVYLNCYVHTHHMDAKKTYGINVHIIIRGKNKTEIWLICL